MTYSTQYNDTRSMIRREVARIARAAPGWHIRPGKVRTHREDDGSETVHATIIVATPQGDVVGCIAYRNDQMAYTKDLSKTAYQHRDAVWLFRTVTAAAGITVPHHDGDEVREHINHRPEKAEVQLRWIKNRVVDAHLQRTRRGVPQLVVYREQIRYNIVYFGRSHSFRVFYPGPRSTGQQRINIKTREEVVQFFTPSGAQQKGS